MADRRYWDTACFIAWLGREAGRAEVCGSILFAAEAGEVDLVTSAFTLTEVLRPKGRDRLDPNLRQTILDFFRHPWITLVQVDRIVAERAQAFVWDRGVRPKDAIHVASAVLAKCSVFETYDSDLIELSGRVGGSPILQIRHPEPFRSGDQKEMFSEDREELN